MQHLVVFQAMQQSRRQAARVAGQEYGSTGGTLDGAALQAIQQGIHGQRILGKAPQDHLAALAPRHHQDEDEGANHQREPATLGELGQIGGKEGKVDSHEDDQRQTGLDQTPVPRRRATL